MKWLLCAAAAGFLAFAPQAAHAQYNRADYIEIEVCNRTNTDVYLAIGYVPLGQSELQMEGWRTIRANQCSVQAETANSYFYVYAEETVGDGYWGGSFDHCVLRPGPWNYPMRGMCSRPGAAQVQFEELHSDAYGGRFTWNLNY